MLFSTVVPAPAAFKRQSQQPLVLQSSQEMLIKVSQKRIQNAIGKKNWSLFVVRPTIFKL
jgi:hypothetical protein